MIPFDIPLRKSIPLLFVETLVDVSFSFKATVELLVRRVFDTLTLLSILVKAKTKIINIVIQIVCRDSTTYLT
jgi:hypothetical protein